MTTPPGPKRQGLTLLLILAIAILLDKFGISRVLPQVSGLIGINPMLVFLDIPVDLSLGFGLLSVTVLFFLLYLILPRSYHTDATPRRDVLRQGGITGSDKLHQAPATGLWKMITGVLAIPCCTLSGGLLYAAAHDHLPKQARHAIESFGINADIYTSFPGYELIHLRGSMIMLACMLIGIHICVRRIRVPAPDPIPVQTLIC
jgi:hypothetical protein